jgi:uncharacterized protein with HEPN domain
MTDQGKKYLSDIVRAIDLIEDFTVAVMGFEDYESDMKTQSAVERQLGIIGEAVKQFDKLYPKETLNKARQIVGFRNRIIHAYDSLDNSMVWAILKLHLQPLKDEVIYKMNE